MTDGRSRRTEPAAAGGCRRTRARGSPRRRRRGRPAPARRWPATASSISRCDASGSCQPVSRPSTARTPRSGVMTTSVQPSPGWADAVVVGDRLQRPHHGGADRDDPAAGGVGAVDQPGGGAAAPGSARGTAPRCPRATTRRCAAAAGRSRRPARTRSVTTSAVKGRAGAGHLGAAGLDGEHRLVVASAASRGRRSGSGSAGRARPGSSATVPGRSKWANHSRCEPANGDEQLDATRRRRSATDWGPSRTSGPVVPPSGWRTSTSHSPPGSWPETWTTTGSPAARRPSTAAATVADVLTTSRSPGSRTVARSGSGCGPGAPRRPTPSGGRRPGARPRASGGSCASRAGSRVKASDGRRRQRRS